MNKPTKKVTTEDKFIDRAEETLGVKYPQILREKLRIHNGFSWGYFERFYCVLDDDDRFHTFDDVVKENTNPSGWQNILPEDYVAIADDGGGYCLMLSKNKDQKVYHYNSDTQEVTLFAEDDASLKHILDKQEEELKNL